MTPEQQDRLQEIEADNKHFELQNKMLQIRIKDVIKERDELKKALSLAGKQCEEVHHPKEMQHAYGTECPVEAFIQKVIQ